MKKKPTESQHTITTLPILPGTLLLCGCTLAVFLAVFCAMAFAGMITLPDFLEGFFGQGSGSEDDDGFAQDFLASLSGSAPDLQTADERLLDLSADSLKELLLASRPSDSYYHCMDITWTDGASVFNKSQVYFIVSEERVYAEIYPLGGTPKYMICDDTQFWIREGNESRLFSRSDDSALTPEGECGIPSLSRMQAMIAASEKGQYTLQLETVQNSPCIRVSFTDTTSGVQEVYDVMPDRGLIVAASSSLPGKEMPYYQVITTAILTDLSGLDASVFEIPNP